MAKKQKINLMEELTTYKCDYQIWPPQVRTKTEYRLQQEPKVKHPPYIPVDPQSHTPYVPSIHVPFDLYLAPKPIVGTDPRQCFHPRKPSEYHKSSDNIPISTVLTPTLDLNEVECREDLETILRYTYSRWRDEEMEDAALKSSKPPQPPNRVVAEGGANIKFKSDLYPALPCGWIAAATHWDCLQNRHLGDPTKSFWTRRGPEIECGCCNNFLGKLLSQETKDEIRKLVSEGKLRLPYDITKTGYGGYRQICAKGVPLGKSERECDKE